MTLNEGITTRLAALSELTTVYKSVLVIGNPNTGKSTGIKILVDALNRLNRQIELQTIFPKSLTQEGFFGKTMTDQTLFPGYIPKVLKSLDAKKENWIVFDCKLDPQWSSNIYHSISNDAGVYISGW